MTYAFLAAFLSSSENGRSLRDAENDVEEPKEGSQNMSSDSPVQDDA
jgi:hypothetical protein